MAGPPPPPRVPAPPPEAPFRAAPAWRRAAACAVDTAAPLAAALAAGWALWPAAASDLPWNALDVAVDAYWMSPRTFWVPLGVWFGLSLLLHAAFEAAGTPTPGQRLLGLRLVDRAGRPLRPVRAVVHAALRLVSTALVAGGHLWALADPARQTLHDRLSGAWLVCTPPEGRAPTPRPAAAKR